MTSANWLDKAIGWLSPVAGARRVAARQAIESLSYNGASKSRRTEGWMGVGSSGNAELSGKLDTLRDNSRELYRNSPIIANLIDIRTDITVGAGFQIRANTGIPELDEIIDTEWRIFEQDCDAEDFQDFAGMTSMAVRTMFLGGEVLTRDLTGHQGRMKLKMLEGDFIDTGKSGEHEGRVIINGVELDSMDRRVAFWMFSRHPGEATVPMRGHNYMSVRNDASRIIHTFRRLRPGDVRGVPLLAPVIATANDLDDYRDAELVRKKIAACFSVFITTPDPNGIMGGASNQQSAATGFKETHIQPGAIHRAPIGTDVKLAQPPNDGNPMEFVKGEQRLISAAAGVPYHSAVGDFAAVNFSAWKGAQIEAKRKTEVLQWTCIIPQLLQPIRRRFIDRLVVAGKISRELRERAYLTEYTPPKFESVEPIKEAEAAVLSMLAGIELPEEILASRGYEPNRFIASYKAWLDKLDAAGIGKTLTSDPRTEIAKVVSSKKPEGGNSDDSSNDQKD